MSHGFNPDLFQDFKNHPGINACRPQQFLAKPSVQFFRRKDLANQRITVAVESAGSQPDNFIPLAAEAAVDHLLPVHHAHTETGEIEPVFFIHSRKFGCLASDQSASGLLTALCDSLDQCIEFLIVQFSAGDIIEEKEGLGSGHHNIIHAHGDQVDPDSVVSLQHLGKQELCTDSIRGRDKNRIFNRFETGHKKTAEAADFSQDLGANGLIQKGFYPLDEGIRSVDIHTGFLIGQGRHTSYFDVKTPDLYHRFPLKSIASNPMGSGFDNFDNFEHKDKMFKILIHVLKRQMNPRARKKLL
ncbi:hypothetical protein ES703_110491 [subsurface metagenome]